MQKTILITGATDGIGLEAAKLLAASGHHVLLHGRNRAKLARAVEAVEGGEGRVEQYVADLSRIRFAPPHPDALDTKKSADVVRAIEAILVK